MERDRIQKARNYALSFVRPDYLASIERGKNSSLEILDYMAGNGVLKDEMCVAVIYHSVLYDDNFGAFEVMQKYCERKYPTKLLKSLIE